MSLRGLAKARCEWLLVCTIHNLLKLWRAATRPVITCTMVAAAWQLGAATDHLATQWEPAAMATAFGLLEPAARTTRNPGRTDTGHDAQVTAWWMAAPAS